MERVYTPPFIIDEMARSVQEAKRRVISLVRSVPSKERKALIKKLIRQSIDEEIDQNIQVRKKRCIRCVHGRFYDESETPYLNLPIRNISIQTIGCDKLQPGLRKSCRRFVERARATSPQDYLGEMALLYELREMFERFNEIWEEYFLL